MAPVGAENSGHVMRPAHTRVEGHRGGRLAADERSFRGVGECGRRSRAACWSSDRCGRWAGDRVAAVVADPDQHVGAGRGECGDRRGVAVVAVGEHDHPGSHRRGEIGGHRGLGGRVGAEHGLEDGAGAAADERNQSQRRVTGAAVVAAVAVVALQVCRAVGHAHLGAVHRTHQPPAPRHPRGAGPAGRAAEQVEQRAQRGGPDRAAGLAHRRGGRDRERDWGGGVRFETGDHVCPHPRIAEAGEQPRGQ
jgi:hypothetical protein